MPAASPRSLASSTAPAGRAAVAGAYDWLQFNGGADHSGNNRQESALAVGNVGRLQRLFQISLPLFFDNAPVALSAVATASGSRDLLFLTTRAGELMALDAHSGATVWTAAHGPGSCRINNGSSVCYTTSAPAIDPARAFVYSYGL
ncbi:MAG: hypothetical protein LC659_09205, partial [Myxococcales bacterium]|nr:hypothetical protein [Myxococcales bacterium]